MYSEEYVLGLEKKIEEQENRIAAMTSVVAAALKEHAELKEAFDGKDVHLRNCFAMGDCGCKFHEFVDLYNTNEVEFEEFKQRHIGKTMLECYAAYKFEYADAMMKMRGV
jgi:hypothetical protein